MMPISVVVRLVLALAGTGAFAWYQDGQIDTLKEKKAALEVTLGTVATLEIQNAACDARENARDDKIKALQIQTSIDIKTLEGKVSTHETKLAWYAGAIAAAGVAWQLLSKTVGSVNSCRRVFTFEIRMAIIEAYIFSIRANVGAAKATPRTTASRIRSFTI